MSNQKSLPRRSSFHAAKLTSPVHEDSSDELDMTELSDSNVLESTIGTIANSLSGLDENLANLENQLRPITRPIAKEKDPDSTGLKEAPVASPAVKKLREIHWDIVSMGDRIRALDL